MQTGRDMRRRVCMYMLSMHGVSELAMGTLLFRPLCRRRLQRYSAAHAALAARNHLHRFSSQVLGSAASELGASDSRPTRRHVDA